MGKTRFFFAGSNSGKGFFSLFDNIIGPEARRVYLLKGGPGTGKSSFMSYIANAAAHKGYARELFFCSSDSKALDAVSFPELGIALIDATFPHVLEADVPGCRDQLISLGDFWSKDLLEEKREEIMAGGRIKKAHFAAAFRFFAAALAVEENIGWQIGEEKSGTASAKEIKEIFALIRASSKEQGEGLGSMRRLFASALTPEGYVSHIESLVEGLRHVFVLSGGLGEVQSGHLAEIASYAESLGFKLEAFHYPLDPDRLLHLIIPGAGVAVLTEHPLEDLSKVKGRRIACGPDVTSLDGGDFRLYQELLQRGFDSLAAAQSSHRFVEEIYASAMDFAALNVYRDGILAEIFS